ncbi:hypothetical protein Glove_117g282 [Diversispora epigaea]|uniref:Uncharacterized protein n=1 Tax=Diversispora epigaea TaxID=1348612 RepID=A0A397JAQ2_9GLOM|nr:hypothetical protein Glove_117g282 [Diversispora epigaea]
MEMIYSVIPENTIFYVIIAVVFIYLRKSPHPIPATLDTTIKDLKRDILALKNDMNRMQNETEWRSEARSQGQASVLSHRNRNPLGQIYRTI